MCENVGRVAVCTMNVGLQCVSKETIHLTFDHNVGKSRSIYNILLLLDS